MNVLLHPVRTWRNWRRNRHRREQCAVCQRELKPRQVRELRSYPDDDARLGISALAGGAGGSYMSETYCAKHYPG